MTDSLVRFEEWWREVEPKLLAIGSRYLGSSDAAHDLAQDVAVVALSRLSAFEDRTQFMRWVVTRARWLALDRLRIARRTLGLLESGHSARPPQEPELWLTEVREALSKLPRHQQLVMQRTIEGWTTGEMAQELGIAEATVRSLRRHARARLIQLLGTREGAG